jgi:lambda family phage portal protein
MKRTLLDRALGYIGLQKRNNSVFSGAQTTRLTLDWVAAILSANQELRGNLRLLRSRGRELSRNNPVAKNFLNLLAGNVVGPKGIGYQPQVRNNNGKLATDLNEKIEDAWIDWGKKGNCTVDGMHSWRSLQDLAIRNVATDGEVFLRHVPGFDNKYRYALQLIDADQVDHTFSRPAGRNQNEIRLGIEVDHWSRPVAYYINAQHPSEIGGSLVRERVEATYILHLFDPSRVNQTRGITWFHAVMLQLRMLEGYIEAELVAARTGAAKMGWLKVTDPSGYDSPNPDAKYKFEANPGTIETLPPGYEFQEWNPDHPANAFPNFVTTMLRQIATGFGVSYNALASDLVGVNYSSMRSGLLIERDQWKRYQSWLCESLLQPVFENWLPMALLSGELSLDSRDPRKFLAGKWEPRGWQWVDPLKDVQAAILAVGAGLRSRDDVISETGGDVEDVFEALAEEKDMADEYGLKFAATMPQKPSVGSGSGSGSDTTDGNENENQDSTTGKKSVVPVRLLTGVK